MRRREFISLLGGMAAAPVLAPLTVHAQQSAPVPMLGFLASFSPDGNPTFVAAFRKALETAGYFDGSTVKIEYRWANDQYDRLPALAAELVERRVNVIVAAGGGVAALAAKNATTTIPIVFINGNDPTKLGLVASLNRPGGNLTGISFLANELGPKRLEILRELVPQNAALRFLYNPRNPNADIDLAEMQHASHQVQASIPVLPASTEGEIEAAFSSLTRGIQNGLVVASDPFFLAHRQQMVALAERGVIPAIYAQREFVDAGGLISYGTPLEEVWREAGRYAARILKGEKPAEMPVLQPTKFVLIINAATAKALGLAIPPLLRATADEVIE
jgi:putative ABC transport system substrate-binding protein